MEQRVKNLEVVCELITKEIVEQNKQMIEMNKSLLNEIRSLREAYVKQDDDFEEFKNLLRKIYELNKAQQPIPNMPSLPPQASMPPPPPHGQFIPPPNAPPHMPHMPAHLFQHPMHHPNNLPFMAGHPSAAAALINQFPFLESQQIKESQSLNQIKPEINQSMVNNASFSDKSTLSMTANQQQQPFAPNSTFGSNYSIPSSTSTMSMSSSQQVNKPQVQQQQQTSVFAKPPAQQQAPFSFGPPAPATTSTQKPFKFGPQSTTAATTSTPQQAHGGQQFLFGGPKPTSPQKQPQQSQQPVTTGIKPPVFDVSPAKPAPATTQTASKPFSFQPFTGSPVTQTPPQASSNSIFKVEPGKNIFSTSPAAKPADMASIFGKQPAPSTTFAAPAAQQQGEEDETGGGNPEEYEPQVEFTPIVHLKEVEVKTGEEDEEVLVKLRCKLFRFDSTNKEWKEKGLGDIKLLKHKESKSIRVLMRREQVLKLCANHKITTEMKLTEIAPKQLSWIAMDYSEGEAKSELLAARFKTPEDADLFKSEFEKAVIAAATLPKSTPKKPTASSSSTATSEMKPSLSQILKTDSWKCNTCYAPNNKDSNKCACCATPRPGVPSSFTSPALSTLGAKEESKPSSTFSFGTLGQTTANQTPSKPPSFSFGLNNAAATTTNTPPKFDFSAKENILKQGNNVSPSTSNTNTATPSLFGTKTLTPATVIPASGQSSNSTTGQTQFLFGNNANTPSFSSLASSTSTGSGGLFGSLNSGNSGNLFSTTTLSSGTPGGFTGMGLAGPSSVKPLFGGTPQIKTGDGDEGEDGDNQNPEEYEPQVEFKPIVQLKEVDVKTGEEDEEAAFKQRCKLYRFDSNTKEWKEKGTGEIKLLKHKENTGMYRLLMRRDQVLKLCLNHRITPDLKFEIFQDKQVRWHAEDYSEGAGKHELLAARFKNESDAKKLVEECTKAQSEFSHDAPKPQNTNKTVTDPCQGLKPSLSEMFKTAGVWSCTQCLVNNDEKASKCAACALPRNKDQTETSTEKEKTQQSQEPPKFSFGTMNSNAPKPSMENVFGTKQGLSFADLAQGSKPFGFSGGFTNTSSPQTLFGSGGGIKPMFGQQTPKTTEDNEEGGDEGGNPEEFEPQIEFKPLVQLKEVEVKTGEEEEEVLFKQRCKLFRFDLKTKEWKEKGTGEIKILKHKSKEGSYRVLMRRDQVLKLCANHKITPDIKVEKLNEKQIRWMANDCSEDTPQLEMLIAKFRQQEDAAQFANLFEEAQKNAKLGGATTTSNVNTAKAAPTGPSLASVLVKSGDWKCDTCLSTNKESANKCGACDSPKPAAKLSENDRDVVFEFAAMPSEELIQKARSLKLPDSFYLYMNKPNCPGCPGCEHEE